MIRSMLRRSIGLLPALVAFTSCIPKQTSTSSAAGSDKVPSYASAPSGPRPVAAAMEKNLSEHFSSKFSLGVALEPRYLGEWGGLTSSTFNRLTAENAMKFGQIHPRRDEYNYGPADELANFARQHSMKMTGHALIWYRETPTWLAAGDEAAVSKRMKSHFEAVIGRYADVTDNWDVVNEGISDSASKIYRDEAEGSKLYPVLGEKLFSIAFSHAEAAVKATGKSIDLYYNDYNMWLPVKLEKTLKMAQSLKAAGIRIDGIGAQAHWNMLRPTVGELQSMIDQIVAAGLKVKISELDVSVYPKDDWGDQVWEAERPFTEELAELQAARYKELFEVFAKNSKHISSVTFWGMSDDRSWLNSFPSAGRRNYPLLFDDADKAKPAYFSLFEVQ